MDENFDHIIEEKKKETISNDSLILILRRAFIAGILGGCFTAAIILGIVAVRSASVQSSMLGGYGYYNKTVAPYYEKSIVNVVKKASPAVFSIVATKEVSDNQTHFFYPDYSDDSQNLFDFFKKFSKSLNDGEIVPQGFEKSLVKKEMSGGTGFIISADGTAITNKHVIEREGAVFTAFTNDGEKHTLTVIAKDPILDIAIVKISGNDFPYLELADSSKLEVGQTAVAIGNALGEFRNTVSTGIVSGLSRSLVANDAYSGGAEFLDEVIQTDAPINPGNSGGPLLDTEGKVIGVNVAMAYGSQNVGFALPSNEVALVVDSVNKFGKIRRPFIGVRFVPVTPDLQEEKNLAVGYGVLVTGGSDEFNQNAIVASSPADRAGLKTGDIITHVDGKKLDQNSSFASIIRRKKIGDSVALRVSRGGSDKSISLILGEAP